MAGLQNGNYCKAEHRQVDWLSVPLFLAREKIIHIDFEDSILENFTPWMVLVLVGPGDYFFDFFFSEEGFVLTGST